jgi:hypothetical protein
VVDVKNPTEGDKGILYVTRRHQQGDYQSQGDLLNHEKAEAFLAMLGAPQAIRVLGQRKDTEAVIPIRPKIVASTKDAASSVQM